MNPEPARANPDATRGEGAEPVRFDSRRAGARAVIPLAIAVGAFGVPFGVLARAAGFTPVLAVVMSATTFGGSAQFAAVSVIGGGGGVAAAVTAALLLNSRYGPIGMTVAPALRGGAVWRFLVSQLVVDESWVTATDANGRVAPRRLMGAGLTLYAAWVAGTALGVSGGAFVGRPERFGLDAAFPALFLALLAPRLRSRTGATAALLGAAIALALIPVARPGLPILAASAACLSGWRRR